MTVTPLRGGLKEKRKNMQQRLYIHDLQTEKYLIYYMAFRKKKLPNPYYSSVAVKICYSSKSPGKPVKT